MLSKEDLGTMALGSRVDTVEIRKIKLRTSSGLLHTFEEIYQVCLQYRPPENWMLKIISF
jgi:hypothetical protein